MSVHQVNGFYLLALILLRSLCCRLLLNLAGLGAVRLAALLAVLGLAGSALLLAALLASWGALSGLNLNYFLIYKCWW